jgi:hypothetical protein
MIRFRPWFLAVATLFLVAKVSAQFADSVVSYSPGLGGSPGYTNAASALGAPARFTPGLYGGPVDPLNPPWQKSQLVSLGTNGAITLHFSSPITDAPGHPFGLDFLIFGNSGFVATNATYDVTGGQLFGTDAVSTRVSVSPDGVTFYTLDPALAPTVNSLYPTDGSGNFFFPVNPALHSSDFGGKSVDGIRALYSGSGGGMGFDLAWAQDASGHPVHLSSAQFVRIEVLDGHADIDAVAAVEVPSRSITEDFSSDPTRGAWNLFGDATLFHWNSAAGNLGVTWDSSHPNSYLRLPLQTILTRNDDFGVAFDLTLNDIAAGVSAAKPGTFQIAIGFQNQADASRTNFIRGTGSDSPNLVEFDFFPDTGFGPTVWPGIFPTNGTMNYSGSSDFSVFDLPVGALMRVSLQFSAASRSATLSITTNGTLVGPITTAHLATNFTAFDVDTFAIASYTDAGQDPSGAGSILAHGILDNIALTLPREAVRFASGSLVSNQWQMSFLSRTNWTYVLESTSNFNTWTNASPVVSGTGRFLDLVDTNQFPADRRFYRISGTRVN